MKVRPLGDKILVQRVEAEEKTTSGIYLPESAKEKPQQAKVLALGAGKVLDNGERAPFTVKEGDTVIIGKWGGTEVKVDGEDYMVMSEDEVLAIVG
ncbi:MAG: co-chaperone GroES [Planctomycetota bacterium]